MTTTVSQPSLWDEPVPAETLELSFSWADGDTDSAQLERLATLFLKYNLDCRVMNGRNVWIRILSTRVADGKVWATWKEVPSPLGTCQPVEEEDDDEC